MFYLYRVNDSSTYLNLCVLGDVISSTWNQLIPDEKVGYFRAIKEISFFVKKRNMKVEAK